MAIAVFFAALAVLNARLCRFPGHVANKGWQ